MELTHRIEPTWDWADRGTTPERECGSCYACCVWLGVAELKKWTGQVCKHLSGASDPCKRCSIYESRPKACSEYKCMWRSGYGPDWMRPADSGILLTPYPSEHAQFAVTMQVIDKSKATSERIYEAITELLGLPVSVELRVIQFESKRVMLFREGNIYNGRLLPGESYESLSFEAWDPPIAHYHYETPAGE